MRGDEQHGRIVRRHSYYDQPKLPNPMWLQPSDHRCPVAKISDARKEKITCTGKEIAGHGENEKISCSRPVSFRLAKKEPKDKCEEQIDESAIRGHSSCLDIALQRHRAQSYLSRPAQPCCHAMAQSFVQDILKNAGQYRHGNHGNPIVLPRAFTFIHSVSYNIQKLAPDARIPLRSPEPNLRLLCSVLVSIKAATLPDKMWKMPDKSLSQSVMKTCE